MKDLRELGWVEAEDVKCRCGRPLVHIPNNPYHNCPACGEILSACRCLPTGDMILAFLPAYLP